MKRTTLLLFFLLLFTGISLAQKKKKNTPAPPPPPEFSAEHFSALKFRNIGPFRGGRTNAVTGVPGDPMTYYFGGVGGGIWKTDDAGISWKNVSDGFLKTGSVGAIAVAPSDPNVLYVGMGEHAVRGVMTSHGDGMYKSTDAGQTWTHVGLKNSRHIAAVRIHPSDHNTVWVAVQGALWGPSEDRGVYKTTDGGQTWKKVHYINENTGAADLSLDANNPRILYAGMWDHQRHPWKVRSGGPGSGLWKSTDGGESWTQLKKGLPEEMGKVSIDVSPANSNVVYANIEAEKGGVFRSNDGGKSWTQTSSARVTITRAWYYIEIFADPVNENVVYVLNAPMLKSIDGGKTFARIANPHGDQHDLWINKDNPQNMILGNDGGGCISFNGGKSWSSQQNQPTAQFYRVIADRQFPYHLYAGQQDNSTVAIASKTQGGGIGIRDWYPVSGGESAFIAFDPDNPELIYGTTIQGFTDVMDKRSNTFKDIMAYPQLHLGTMPKDMRYRYNWNPPIVAQEQDPSVMYQGAQLVLRTDDGGHSWTEISPDLTRNDTSKHQIGGEPFTNEGAGGEVYNTISYIEVSPHTAGVIWVGTDDGLVHVTQDEGKNWSNVTPYGLEESLINAIEVSPHDPATAYIAVTRYKFHDLSPMIFKTTDFGQSWTKIINGLPADNFVRVVREDTKTKGLLYAGTEGGLYISLNDGKDWKSFQSNLPICPITDLTIADNDLVVATSGRAFWILDDLSALQQSGGLPDTTAMVLYTPKPTVKFTLSGSNPPNNGKNPLPGIILDYYLPHTWVDSNELKLEVLDAYGNTVRTYTNQKPEKFKSWEGGPSKPVILPAKAGLNRFNWNLQTDPNPSVERIFVMGGHNGHLAAPGTYTIRLSSGDQSVETKAEVLPHPKLRSTAADHTAQQQMLNEIDATVKDIHESVTQLRGVKEQLNTQLKFLKEQEGQEAVVEKGETALEAITKWEENLVQPKQKTFQDVINFRNKLNAELIFLKAHIDALEPKPTAQGQERLKALTDSWKQLKTDMNAIINTEMKAFNDAYQAAGLPALILPKK
jgi:photosystem II stability/assembly factor-like uncharacterized protein/uncharacterized protein YoxC